MKTKSALLKFVDSFVGPLACAVLSRPQKSTERRVLSDTEGAILVIRPGGIGDAVMLLPMLFALREIVGGATASPYPRVALTSFANPATRPSSKSRFPTAPRSLTIIRLSVQSPRSAATATVA